MVFRPAKALGMLVGIVILITILSVDALLVGSVLRQGLGVWFFIVLMLLMSSLPLISVWLYWFAQFLLLRYHIDRNALVIACGTHRYVVPLGSIERLVRGDEVEASRGFRGVGWPGYMNGRLRLKRLGWLVSLSTEPLQRQLIVVTEAQCYGISPRDPTEFLHHYVQYRALGAVAAIEQGVERNLLLRLPLWSDLAFWGAILVAFVANVALFGLIMARYGALPERIPLHFNAQGEPLRIASKAWLLLVPGIGAAALFVNALLGAALHRWERLGARLLVFAALGVQAIVWSAALVVLAHGRG